MAIKKFDVELVSTKMISPNTMHLSFKILDNIEFDYIPGHFITFLFESAGDKVKRRSYSIATLEKTNNLIEIAISYIKTGVASESLFHAKIGERFNVMGPAGRLILKEEAAEIKRLVLVGTGTGIAPYRAMLSIIAKLNLNVTIILGVQHRIDAIYSEDFIHYSEKFSHISFQSCLSREESQLNQYETKGYVQHYFDNIDLNPDEDIIYLCGNPNMIDDSYEKLLALGFETKNIRREKYISPK
jgi:NAD(P)H-flavin reductase